MRFLSFLLISLFSLIASIPTWAISDSDLNVRNVNITTTNATNPLLESFIAPIQGFFFAP